MQSNLSQLVDRRRGSQVPVKRREKSVRIDEKRVSGSMGSEKRRVYGVHGRHVNGNENEASEQKSNKRGRGIRGANDFRQLQDEVVVARRLARLCEVEVRVGLVRGHPNALCDDLADALNGKDFCLPPSAWCRVLTG